MDNPWIRLPGKPPYVLSEDAPIIHAENAKLRHRGKGTYQLQCLPDPYAGRLDAPVVILNLNPGYSPATPGIFNSGDDYWHAQPLMKEAYRRNFEQQQTEYPMFFLDPALEHSPGGQYWSTALADLVAICGKKEVAQNLLVIESLPYHSRSYTAGVLGLPLPSLNFTHYQIREALTRKATVLMLRHERGFLRKVPELASYPYLRVNSSQSGHISRGNVPRFSELLEKLCFGKSTRNIVNEV